MQRTCLLPGLLLFVLLAMLAPAASAQEATGRLCVSAFHDANQDGLRAPLEPLLAEVAVYLHNAQMIVINTYLTTGQGEPHCFDGLAPGDYSVTFGSGAHIATGQEAFTVTLSAGQIVPPQVEFGAVPADLGAAQTADVTPALDPMIVRLALSCLGSVVAMILMTAVSLIIYRVRYRRA